MRFKLTLLAILFFNLSFGQFYNFSYSEIDSITKNRPPEKWVQSNSVGLDVSEVAFVNWNAGGSNSISALLNVFSSIRHNNNNLVWIASFRSKYGVNKQENQKLRKTEDELELSSTLGYRKNTITNWYYSARFNFKTQYGKGYDYPNRENEISRFMAPGYLFLGVEQNMVRI